MIMLVVDGYPVPWKAHGGFGRRSFNPRFKEKEYYQWQLRAQWNQEVVSQPVSLECTYHFPIPKGTSRARQLQMLNGMMHHIKRPDCTNLQKFIEDCLKGIVIEDDSQVVEIVSKKVYGLVPKSVIKINII